MLKRRSPSQALLQARLRPEHPILHSAVHVSSGPNIPYPRRGQPPSARDVVDGFLEAEPTGRARLIEHAESCCVEMEDNGMAEAGDGAVIVPEIEEIRYLDVLLANRSSSQYHNHL